MVKSLESRDRIDDEIDAEPFMSKIHLQKSREGNCQNNAMPANKFGVSVTYPYL